jgi:hypothetical protein
MALFLRVLDHTQRHTTVGRTPLDEWSACRKDLNPTTHNTHKRHPCPGGIRSHYLSRRAAADLRRRPRGHWDRRMNNIAIYGNIVRFVCYCFVAPQPNAGYGLLIHEVSRSHTTTHHSRRTPLDDWTARRRHLYLTTHNSYKRQTSMPPLGFELTI